jgi:ligand-binding sensor domain-containing protein/serine phosphatase RsbU (regulator of sigma subunit)
MLFPKKYIARAVVAIFMLIGPWGLVALLSQTLLQKQLDIHNGLTSNKITCTFQDSRGYLWIGTEDGLNRYDGYNVVAYRHSVGDDKSISDNFIQSIYEVRNGDLYIGTRFGGLNRWVRSSNEFEQLQKKSGLELGLPENEIYDILESDDGRLWVKTRNFLANVGFEEKSVSSFGHFTNMFKSEDWCRNPIALIRDGLLLVGTKDGLNVFDSSSKTFTRVKHYDRGTTYFQCTVFDIVPFNDKFLIAGDCGFWIYDPAQGNLLPCNFVGNVPFGVSVKLFSSKTGAIWIGSGNALYKLDVEKQAVEKVFVLNDKNGPLDDHITSLVEDFSGIVWVGTRNSGVFKVDFRPTRFMALPQGINHWGNVTALKWQGSDILWVGTMGKGLWKYLPQNSQSIEVGLGLSMTEKKACVVSAIYMSKNQQVWIGTNNGIYIHRPLTGKTEEFDYLMNKEFKTLLKNNEVRAITEDVAGNVWFATKFGLYRYNGKQIESFFHDAENFKSLNHDEVNCLLVDKDNVLWVGTRKGVNRFELSGKGFDKLSLINQNSNSMCNDYVLSLAEDADGNILIGTRGGLARYNKVTKACRLYSVADGLTNDVINSIATDDVGRIWLGTNYGISCIVENVILNFTGDDGLAGVVFHPNAVAKNSKGELFFGGSGGVSLLAKGSIDLNKMVPNVVINSLRLYRDGDLVAQRSGELGQLELKHSQNTTLRIDFAALEFTQPQQNRYKTMLEGYDTKWSTSTADNFMVYSNLPPGKYTFKIVGSNNDFVWSDKPAELSIVITPPLYRSIYAILFYILAAFLLIQAIVNYRVQKYRKAYINMRDRVEDSRKHEVQKETLAKINKSLTDSINYAKRIQEAILFSEDAIKRLVPDSFIYFRPKDIVSGDFYYFHVREGKLIVASVDCTGHGVPGAFMSIIGYDLLRNIIEIQGVDCPATVLDMLNEQLNHTFSQDNMASPSRYQEVNDGMDLSICVIDYEKRLVEFAGANSSLYLVRDNELETFDGNRMAIGLKEASGKFTKQQISLYNNDILYLFSDGYIDQFGGPEGKKFKYRRFRHLLLNIHKMPMEDQKAILHQKMEEWMGESYEQVDDILLIGIKPIQSTLM